MTADGGDGRGWGTEIGSFEVDEEFDKVCDKVSDEDCAVSAAACWRRGG
jgi:hypothetical protein